MLNRDKLHSSTLTMSKLLPWVASLPFVLMPIVSSVQAIEPDSPCYIQTHSGEIVNLIGLCNGRPTTIPTATSPSRLRNPSTSNRQFSSEAGNKVSEGRGGYYDKQTGVDQDYYYELWANQKNTRYTLKVWDYDRYPNGSPTTVAFPTSRAAVDYFDCYYAGKSLPSCLKD